MPDFGDYLPPDGTVNVPSDTYDWDGTDLDIGSSDALIGTPSTIVNLNSGTMDGSVRGTLEQITIRGANYEPKSGINVYPGATIDGFVWPEGGQQDEDRAIYTPDGGDDRLFIRNSAVGHCTSDTFYVDKPPVTIENTIGANNNISNIRLGHRDGTSNPEGTTSYARNCQIAVTRQIESDSTNNPNARGLHISKPGTFVIEDCYFIYKDVSGAGPPVELDGDSDAPTITFRNCHFHIESDIELFNDETGGAADVTIEDCTLAGGGDITVGVSYDGNGFTAESKTVPLPSDVTGMPAADDIDGIGPGESPWGSTSTPSGEHELQITADSGNPDDGLNMELTVDGGAELGTTAGDSDYIDTNPNGTQVIHIFNMAPGESRTYFYDGDMLDYSVTSGYNYTVTLDGSSTTFSNLVATPSVDGPYSNGEAVVIGGADGGVGDTIEWDIRPEYRIEPRNQSMYLRLGAISKGPALEVEFNGRTVHRFSDGFSTAEVGWVELDGLARGTIREGRTYTLKVTQSGATDSTYDPVPIDTVAVVDNRFNYTFDETLSETGYLDGPQLYPASYEAMLAYHFAIADIAQADLEITAPRQIENVPERLILQRLNQSKSYTAATSEPDQTSITTIEDFETDLSGYSGDTGAFNLQSTTVLEGSQSLELASTADNTDEIILDTGPTVERGDDLTVLWQNTGSNDGEFYFGVTDEDSSTFSGLGFVLDSGGGLRLVEYSSGSRTTTTQTNNEFLPNDETVRVHITWNDDDSFTAEVKDLAGDVTYAEDTMAASHPSGTGGIGWNATAGTCYADAVVRTRDTSTTTTTITPTDTLDNFEDGDISEYSGDTGSFSVQSTTVLEGAETLALISASSNTDEIIATQNWTVEREDTIRVAFQLASGSSAFSFFFGTDGVDSGTLNGADVYLDAGADAELGEWSNGSWASQDTAAHSMPTGTPLVMVIDWASNDTITVDVMDEAESTTYLTLSAAISTLTSPGGFGFDTYNDDAYADDVRRTYSETTTVETEPPTDHTVTLSVEDFEVGFESTDLATLDDYSNTSAAHTRASGDAPVGDWHLELDSQTDGTPERMLTTSRYVERDDVLTFNWRPRTTGAISEFIFGNQGVDPDTLEAFACRVHQDGTLEVGRYSSGTFSASASDTATDPFPVDAVHEVEVEWRSDDEIYAYVRVDGQNAAQIGATLSPPGDSGGIGWSAHTGRADVDHLIAERGAHSGIGHTDHSDTYPSGGVDTIRGGVQLQRYGERDTATPRLGHRSQSFDYWDLTLQLDEKPTTATVNADNTRLDVLQTVAEIGNELWQVSYDEGADSLAINYTHPQARTGEFTGGLSDYDIEKTTRDRIERAVVYGAAKNRTRTVWLGEDILPDDDNGRIIPGSETISDPAYESDPQTYTRGIDYEVDYMDGTLTRLTDFDVVEVEFEYKPGGEYTLPSASADPATTVETVNWATDTQTCEQIAYLLVEEASEPRFEATVTLPRLNVTQSLVESLDVSDLPTNGRLLEVDDIDHTTENILLSMGVGRSIADIINDLATRIDTAEDRL